MKTGWTSLGSAARCPQGRGGWSRGLISCFLHHARSGLWFSLPLLLSRSDRTRNETRGKERPREWDSDRGKRARAASQGKRREPGWHSPLLGSLSGYTYSDCRFKCLLITKLVPQPPRSRSLCIFISTSYGRFREREDVSYSSADAAADRLSSPLRDTRQDDSSSGAYCLSTLDACARD